MPYHYYYRYGIPYYATFCHGATGCWGLARWHPYRLAVLSIWCIVCIVWLYHTDQHLNLNQAFAAVVSGLFRLLWIDWNAGNKCWIEKPGFVSIGCHPVLNHYHHCCSVSRTRSKNFVFWTSFWKFLDEGKNSEGCLQNLQNPLNPNSLKGRDIWTAPGIELRSISWQTHPLTN